MMEFGPPKPKHIWNLWVITVFRDKLATHSSSARLWARNGRHNARREVWRGGGCPRRSGLAWIPDGLGKG